MVWGVGCLSIFLSVYVAQIQAFKWNLSFTWKQIFKNSIFEFRNTRKVILLLCSDNRYWIIASKSSHLAKNKAEVRDIILGQETDFNLQPALYMVCILSTFRMSNFDLYLVNTSHRTRSAWKSIDWLYQSFIAHQHQKGHTLPKQVSPLGDDDITESTRKNVIVLQSENSTV